MINQKLEDLVVELEDSLDSELGATAFVVRHAVEVINCVEVEDLDELEALQESAAWARDCHNYRIAVEGILDDLRWISEVYH